VRPCTYLQGIHPTLVLDFRGSRPPFLPLPPIHKRQVEDFDFQLPEDQKGEKKVPFFFRLKPSVGKPKIKFLDLSGNLISKILNLLSGEKKIGVFFRLFSLVTFQKRNLQDDNKSIAKADEKKFVRPVPRTKKRIRNFVRDAR